ncbi:bifunctional coenzyme A synthase [Cylas formicarius]|uniref:bifunctional coenzyme A synthase n=1 Tax=Cylas formicarius TaxID=197179 RepID=UPI0029587825|nr:bifunctional coenzyme A synthase [Cylas formicarius]
MLAKTGLLIVSNPQQISKVLRSIQNRVQSTLYIQLLSALTDQLGNFCPGVFTTWPKFNKTIFGIYSQAAKYCNDLDVQVLLSGLKYNIPQIKTRNPIDIVIFDKEYTENEINNFINLRLSNVSKKHDILTVHCGGHETLTEEEGEEEKIVEHSVLGGTFDRLHVAHKLILSEAILRSKSKVTIGVTNENLIQGKLLWELIEDKDTRIKKVKNFITDICPELEYEVVEISDPFGPAIVDPTMELIVVSPETVRGGQKINEIRKEKQLHELEIVSIRLIDEPKPDPIEEPKISSSNTRLRLLGTLFKSVEKNDCIPKKPYIIGLTGGIASGKSGVAEHLQELGGLIINCDKLGHNAYKPGCPCYNKIVQQFGRQVLDTNGEIDRKVLGSIVFKNPDDLNKLNELVWPAIAEEIKNIIKNTDKEIVVVEAAVLLRAGWQRQCHEVWTTIVPPNEAIRRLISRNNLNESEAKKRLDALPPNTEYVRHAHVVFCTLWQIEYTKLQVIKAWNLLQARIP